MDRRIRKILDEFYRECPEHIAGILTGEAECKPSEWAFDPESMRAFLVWAMKKRKVPRKSIESMWMKFRDNEPDRFTLPFPWSK